MTQFRALALLAALGALAAPAVEVDLPRFPALSPDGQTVVFSWRGDLWRASSRGGPAQRLTRDAASDARSAWSPDGRQIAFDSERSGALNLWVMEQDGSGLRQVTHSDVGVALAGWAPDGQHLLATAAIEGDVYRSARPYRVAAAGGPLVRLTDAYGASPQLSPDGHTLAFVRGGSSWYRRHYRGPDARDVWLLDTRDGSFRRLTQHPGNDGRPRWLDGDTLAYLSDLDGTVNVWLQDLAGGEPRQATRFTEADATAFDVAHNGSWAVAVSWDALYGWDPRDPQAAPQRLSFSAPDDGPPRLKRVQADTKVSEVALHPFGEAVALVAYGRVFVRGLQDEDSALVISPGPDRAQGVCWSPDGRELYFVSDRDGTDSIYRARVTLDRREVLERYRQEVPGASPWALGDTAPPTEPEEPRDPTGAELALRWRTALEVEVGQRPRGHSRARPRPELRPQRALPRLPPRPRRPGAPGPGASPGPLPASACSCAAGTRACTGADPDGRHLAYASQDRSFNSDVFRSPSTAPPRR
ncbi:MAG: hypothetical protein R3F62_21420 [Planctomycetota bacterium]